MSKNILVIGGRNVGKTVLIEAIKLSTTYKHGDIDFFTDKDYKVLPENITKGAMPKVIYINPYPVEPLIIHDTLTDNFYQKKKKKKVVWRKGKRKLI